MLKISAVIPCHNAEKWIKETLDSVRCQRRAPDQVIIVDDASTDRTSDIVQSWAEQTEIPVKLLRVNERNAAATRNAAVDVADAGWVAMLDADDVWTPEHLLRAESLVGNTQDIAFLGLGGIMSIGGGLKGRAEQAPLCSTKSGLGGYDYVRLASQQKRWRFNHCTVLYQKERFLEVGGYDVNMVRRHDIDLWLRVISGRTWTYDARLHAIARLTPKSLSANKADASYYHLLALLKNRSLFDGPEIEGMLRRHAFKAVSHAWTDGTESEQSRAVSVAWPRLAFWQKTVLWPFRHLGSWYREANLLRRKLIGAARLQR